MCVMMGIQNGDKKGFIELNQKTNKKETLKGNITRKKER